jgi:hypothetical protein
MTDSPCPDTATLAAYVGGRLDDDALVSVSTHLVECARCYDAVALEARLSSQWSQSVSVPPSWPLLPALLTATVMAIALTLCLLKLTPIS